jgi:hypothetical protein
MPSRCRRWQLGAWHCSPTRRPMCGAPLASCSTVTRQNASPARRLGDVGPLLIVNHLLLLPINYSTRNPCLILCVQSQSPSPELSSIYLPYTCSVISPDPLPRLRRFFYRKNKRIPDYNSSFNPFPLSPTLILVSPHFMYFLLLSFFYLPLQQTLFGPSSSPDDFPLFLLCSFILPGYSELFPPVVHELLSFYYLSMSIS